MKPTLNKIEYYKAEDIQTWLDRDHPELAYWWRSFCWRQKNEIRLVFPHREFDEEKDELIKLLGNELGTDIDGRVPVKF